MNRAPAALVLSLALSGTRTVGAEPCAPRAQLEGDREAIERVTSELQKLGVTIEVATATCPSLQARVELDTTGGIAVAVRADAHRSEGRVVSDAALAAAWIDSWVRDDLEVATWPGTSTTSAAPTSALLAPPSAATPHDATPPAPMAASWLARSSFSAAYELAQTSDRSSFSGFGVAGCVHVGALCVGGRIRAGFESQLSTGLSAAARSDMAALATASFPVPVGEMTIAPEAGLGVGRFSTRRLEGCAPAMPPNCDPSTDPNCMMPPADGNGACTPDANGMLPGAGKVYVGDHFDAATFTPRVSLALRVAVSLVKYIWLDGFAGIELIPLGHTDPFVPGQTKGMITPEDAKLPGEPTYSARLGIGIRVGAP